MRVLFCGGGTAGHVYPALAIIETILCNDTNAKIAYVVNENGIENRLVKYKKYCIDTCSIKKSMSISNIKNILRVCKSIKQSKNIIKEFRPDIIFGTGGYASFPVLYAGQKLGIKTVIHESNCFPGKVVKLLSKKANYVLLNFKESQKFLDNKVNSMFVGNPVRACLRSVDKETARKVLNFENKKVIVIFGGSLGAKRINEIAIDLIENYVKFDKDIILICCTGKRYYSDFRKNMKEKHLERLSNVIVKDYIDNLPDYILASDIVICRSGAMTVSELAASEKCAIFVPSPNVTDNHQYHNAKILSDAEAAILVVENEKYLITEIVRELIEKPEKRKKYENNIRKFCKEDSNKLIFQLLNELKNKK